MTDTGAQVHSGISEREAEVLALLGNHLTNAQIAGRLVISVRTVESHVSSLLRKLGVADRRSLAGLAPAVSDREGSPPTSPSLPDTLTSFVGRESEPAAVWAEAGVLATLPDRRARLDRARFLVRENPVAAAMVERADALDTGDHATLLAMAATLDAAGCPYQAARTLVLADGEARAEGRSRMAEIGAAPMARP